MSFLQVTFSFNFQTFFKLSFKVIFLIIVAEGYFWSMQLTTERFQALMDHLFKNCPHLFLLFNESINLMDVDVQGIGKVEVSRPEGVVDRDYKDVCMIVDAWK